ncbi:MAG: sigma-70 family RNA polymerase sigma factor [Acidobacteria bacterium]|nr:sigma-70 family RNA polymerase sigma factor [Acidobacteriota bacterium]
MAASQDITALLKRFQAGDADAQSQLMTAVYGELRMMAARYMARERMGHTLQTTALVNEAYLRLVNIKTVDWHDRAHFFAVAAQMMRRILVDHARHRASEKAGGRVPNVFVFNEEIAFSEERSEQLLQLDDALERLAQTDERASKIIELRFFGGLTTEETAAVLKVSTRTVEREWTFGRAWLRAELNVGGGDAGQAVG